MTTPRKISDDELRRLGRDELVKHFRLIEGDYLKMVGERAGMMKDMNQRMHIHLMEIRGLKDVNQKLQDDNQELRDLCCFLDDDRQKGRKLAREWQRFGRYTSSVMRSEVAAYQHKLKELEASQEVLMKENLELKELCLFLDGERGVIEPPENGAVVVATRAEGDGSSSSSPSTEKLVPDEPGLGFEVDNNNTSNNRHRLFPPPDASLSEQQQQYEQLEQRLQAHKSSLTLHLQQNLVVDMLYQRNDTEGGNAGPEMNNAPPRKFFSTPQLHSAESSRGFLRNNVATISTPSLQLYGGEEGRAAGPHMLPARAPSTTAASSESVMQAMKVLEVHEQLERSSVPLRSRSDGGQSAEEEDMGEAEKAIVREMCNVVWRKLGDAVPGYKTPV